MEGSIFIVADFFLTPKLAKGGSIFDITPVWQRLQTRDKSSELLLPIMQRGRRCNN